MKKGYCLNEKERAIACDMLQTVELDLKGMGDKENLKDLRKVQRKLKC